MKRRSRWHYYHATNRKNADAILKNGFHDKTITWFTGTKMTGVWLADRPLDENEGTKGEIVLDVTLEAELSEKWELVEDRKPYREWCVPASFLDEYAKILETDAADVPDDRFSFS